MGRRSRIDQLPVAVREAVDIAIFKGATVDQVAEAIQSAGENVSRGAVGRYTQKYSEVVRRQREVLAMAKANNAEEADPASPEARFSVQLGQTIVTTDLIAEATAPPSDKPPDWTRREKMAKTLESMSRARKITAEAEASIRDNQRERDAQIATAAAKKAGATPETIDLIRRELLGIA